ncbi:hypothetical protein ScPMuIL_000222 [Solemya velum]
MAFDLGGLGGAQEVMSAGAALQMDPDKIQNNPEIELQWAMKAYHHAETYFSLISAVDPACLKLTSIDDEIYTHFRKEFPDFQVDVLEEEEFKSEAAKQRWRPFCSVYEHKAEDYNFGTLLRLDAREDYSEANSILVLRIQFLAIEISRNREGHNSGLRKKNSETSEPAS